LDDIPVQLRYRVADAIAVQAKARGSVSTRLYEKLKRVLGPKGVERLAEFIPVPVPGSVPFDPADVLTWYERSYLPWRTHPTMDPERARVTQSEFESWVLDQHPNMRTHPDNMALLGWVRVDRLQQSDRGTGITLLVIADGLGIDDIDRMKRTISQTDKLMISRSEYVFTQIPTVTDLTKPIIVNGDLSSKSVEENGDKITRLDEVIRRLRVAKSGDFLAWTHAQPDHAYHFTSGKHEGANQVGAQLDVISKGIVDLFEQLPHLDLRVILTTDHGRFHGKGTRLLVAPPGLNPHGRAAWGQTSRSLNSIYESRDGMVWLNPHSYGLTPGYSYVVALGDSMFTTSDSKGGSEWYPHGGLSPEEVIVPWVEICRQSAIRNLFVEISGSGTAHKTGTLVLNIANPNEVPVKLVSCAVSSDSSERVGDSPDSAPPFMPIDMPLNFVSIPELNSKHIPVEISSWPFTKPNENVVGRLVYQLPSGEERSVSVSASIATQSMYNPTLTLDDLEDL
jgi:hypothetical protein